MFLVSSGSDPLKHLLTQGLTSDCSNHIDSSFLLPDVCDPLKKDVLQLGDVDIAGFTALHCGKSLLEVSFDLISIGFSSVEAFCQLLDLLSLHPCLFITSVNQLTARLSCLLVLSIKLALNRSVVFISPSSKSSL